MNLIKKFKPAFCGLNHAIHDRSIRLQCCIGLITITIGMIIDLDSISWLALLSAIAFVIICETINTAIERLCDVVQPHHDRRIAYIKDLSAAFVMMASIYAIIIAVWILIHIME